MLYRVEPMDFCGALLNDSLAIYSSSPLIAYYKNVSAIFQLIVNI